MEESIEQEITKLIEQEATKLIEDYNSSIEKLSNSTNSKIHAILTSTNDTAAADDDDDIPTNEDKIKLVKYIFNNQVAKLIEKLHSDMLEIKNKISPNIENKNKKALLIGINYNNSKYELDGCMNDTQNIKLNLTTRCGFNEDNILVLSDTTLIKPTKQNILDELIKLLSTSVAGDILFFSYSGHGTDIFVEKKIKEEDELIVTSDLEYIMNYELDTILKDYLNKDVTLFLLFDSCQSDTIVNLKYKYLDTSVLNLNITKPDVEETVGNVYMISSSMNSTLATETNIDDEIQGVMTWAFLKTLNIHKSKPLSWSKYILTMRNILKQKNYKQIPQFHSGKSICLVDNFIL